MTAHDILSCVAAAPMLVVAVYVFTVYCWAWARAIRCALRLAKVRA
jgi:hypothetical protein